MDLTIDVIGLNTAIIYPAQGICFAISSNIAQFIAGWLIKNGRIQRSYIGFVGQTTPLPRPMVRRYSLQIDSTCQVISVGKNRPAKVAEIKNGDNIMQFDNQNISSIDDLHKCLTDTYINRKTKMTVFRLNNLQELIVESCEERIRSN